MTGGWTLLLSGSPSCAPFSGQPQSLGFSKQAREQGFREIEQIESICFRQRALVSSIVAVLMNGSGQLSKSFRQLSVLEKPRKTHAQIPSCSTVDAYRTFRRQQRTCSQIQSHAEHGGRSIPAADRDAPRAFIEGVPYVSGQIFRRLNVCRIFHADIALQFEVLSYVVIYMFPIFVDIVRFRVRFVFNREDCALLTFATNGVNFEVMLPFVFHEPQVKIHNIKRHALSAAPWAISNNRGHSIRFRDHQVMRRVWHVFEVQAAPQAGCPSASRSRGDRP